MIRRILFSSISFLFVLVSTASCSKEDNANPTRSEAEASALLSSAFEAKNVTGDTGVIGGPGSQTGGTNDGGFIPGPSDSTGTGGDTGGSTTSQDTTGSTDSTSGTTADNSGTVSGGSTTTDPNSGTTSSDTGSQDATNGSGTASNDSGSVDSGSSSSTGDSGGSVASSGGGTSDTTSNDSTSAGPGVSSSDSTSSGSSDTSSNDSTSTGSGSTSSSGDSNSSGSTTSSGDSSSSGSSDTASNDSSSSGSGTNSADSTSSGSDSGSGSSSGSSTDGSSSTGSTDSASNDSGSSDSGSGGSAGGVEDQFALCHLPPGNIYNAHTITIGAAAVPAHLKHGDYLGECKQRERKVVNIEIQRLCSKMRTTWKEFKFFEEASNPTLVMEAYPSTSCYYSVSRQLTDYYNTFMAGFSNLPSHADHSVLVSSKSIKGNLLDSTDAAKFEMSLYPDVLKDNFGKNWSKGVVVATVCDDTNNDGQCKDQKQRDMLSIQVLPFQITRAPDFMKVGVWSGRGLLLSKDPDYCEKQYSPIVMDTTGNGISLTGPESGIQFDLNDTGSELFTGWTYGKDDAFLVRDINGNGIIDSGAELFGSATRLQNGMRASNGFEALRELDTNLDGLLTIADETWDSIDLWFDKNKNGFTELDEVRSINQSKIKAINLDYIEMMEEDRYGNQTRQRSTFRKNVRGQEASFLMIDVWFKTLTGY